MTPPQIETIGDLLYFLGAVVGFHLENSFSGSLEEYLRALWAALQENQRREVTPALIGELFLETATREPAAEK